MAQRIVANVAAAEVEAGTKQYLLPLLGHRLGHLHHAGADVAGACQGTAAMDGVRGNACRRGGAAGRVAIASAPLTGWNRMRHDVAVRYTANMRYSMTPIAKITGAVGVA